MTGSSYEAAFQWGNKVPGTESSYESMCLNGVWYNLHECVFCRSGRTMPFVGKLMRLFEDEAGDRKARIRWFFRPHELPGSVIKDLGKDINNSNELFIALGNVKGVENENFVEVICGKAMVLCTARYGENMIPSSADINVANHVFSRAYDVVQKKVVKMANISNKQLASKFANKLEWLAMGPNVEVEDSMSTTFEEGQPQVSMKKFSVATSKRHLVEISSMERDLSKGKKIRI